MGSKKAAATNIIDYLSIMDRTLIKTSEWNALVAELKTMCVDFVGPLGQKPMEKIVRGNIQTFMKIRAAGASWPQITALLAKHGIRTKGGNIMSPDQLRATVSRVARQVPLDTCENSRSQQNPLTSSLPFSPPPFRSPPRQRTDVERIRERMRRSAAARDDNR